jgi:hypothetical protein
MLLESKARPAFLTACACHAAFALMGALATEYPAAIYAVFVLIAGALAFITAGALGLRLLLNQDEGMHRRWIKAALVFLALGPLAYWFLQWPAIDCTMWLDRCFDAGFEERALGDAVQSQIAMTGVAFAALFCAARATTAPLGELAL